MSKPRPILGAPIPPVQDANSTKNNNIADVIGNKLDTHVGNSLYSKIEKLDEHIHHTQLVYPALANPVTVTASASAWTLGAFVEIVPINTITSDFDIHFVDISSISANDEYELHLFYGTTIAAIVPFTKSASGEPSVPLNLQTVFIPANAQIQAKLASKAAVARTVAIKIAYHTY